MSLTHRLTAPVGDRRRGGGRAPDRNSNQHHGWSPSWSPSSGAANNSILACSVRRTMSAEHMDLLYSRKLCEDRKGVFDHFLPNRLLKSTLRVVIMQGTQVATLYLNDQLKEEMARDELVTKGKLTRKEADEESDDWAEREWKKRWEGFPHKLAVAFAKYHSIILVMRFYEHMASKFVDMVTLDRLTIDTFESAKRSSKAGKEGTELARDVAQTSLRAGFIAYLADYTVHQFILMFTYYVYVQEKRRQRRKLQDLGGTGEGCDDEGAEVGSLALSFMKNSVLLAISRGIGLLCSSIGAGIGAMVTPGWGSLAGANLGDGLAMAVSEEIVSPNAPAI